MNLYLFQNTCYLIKETQPETEDSIYLFRNPSKQSSKIFVRVYQGSTVMEKFVDEPMEGRHPESLKLKRRTLRGKVTRAINRIKGGIASKSFSKSRVEKELKSLRSDYDSVMMVNAELFEFSPAEEQSKLEEWEDLLSNDLYGCEEIAEAYCESLLHHKVTTEQSRNPSEYSRPEDGIMKTPTETEPTQRLPLEPTVSNSSGQSSERAVHNAETSPGMSNRSVSEHLVHPAETSPGTSTRSLSEHLVHHAGTSPRMSTDSRSEHTVHHAVTSPGTSNLSRSGHTVVHIAQSQMSPGTSPHASEHTVHVAQSQMSQGTSVYPHSGRGFDSWIDDLQEYQETVLVGSDNELTVAEALFRLEASRDVPSLELGKFSGDPLSYVNFIDSFRIHVHEKRHLSDNVRMMQLKMHLTGNAEKCISGLGSAGLMYPSALKLLKEQFGQPSVIARAWIDSLIKGEKLDMGDRNGLRELSIDLVNCCATLHRLSYFSDANSSECQRNLVGRLPDKMIHEWKGEAVRIRDRGKTPQLGDISEFIRKRVRAQFDPDFGDLAISNHGNKSKQGVKRERGLHATSEKKPVKCFICELPHRVSECPTFVDSPVAERTDIAKEKKLCYGCLRKGHMFKECNAKKACGKNGCEKKHHPLLHKPPAASLSSVSPIDQDAILPIVRVQFRASNGRIREGNVFLDSGAAATVIRTDFARALGLQGKKECFEVSVVGGSQVTEIDSRRVKFWLSPLEGGEEFQIEANEMQRTVCSVPPLDKTWLSSFSHLSTIEFPHKAGPVDLILGLQYSHLHAELEVRQGLPFEPVAKRSRLGWFVIGPEKTRARPSICSFGRKETPDLSQLYDLETLGVRAPDCNCPIKLMSSEDKKAMEMFNDSCHKDGDRYVIGLPWKQDPAQLPNNRVVAERRLSSLERGLAKDPVKAELYDSVVKQYLEKGWAVPVTEDKEPEDKPVYYLPHHGVYRPGHPSTPLRVVFDPACTFKGISLNSFLLKGPNLIGNLLGVLLRFREERVAIFGDISKMFLQIKLKEEDCDVHRFLWRNMETDRKPDVFKLVRVTFGDKPSPDMASFVMLKLAETFEETHPEAADILRHDRYMDDLPHSCPSIDEAGKRMDQVDEVLGDGKFVIKQWYCSAPVDGKPEMKDDMKSTVDFNSQDSLKPLGVVCLLILVSLVSCILVWRPSDDVITYKVKDMELAKFTKRSVLSKMQTVFDPLGLATPVTIRARVAIQAIWNISCV